MRGLRRIVTIFRQDLRVARTDFIPVMLLIVMPVLLMPFLKPAAAVALRVEGFPGATGAEHVVPGMAVTFGFFLVGNVSIRFYREHAWKTWERLRSSSAGAGEILIGKMVTPLLEATAQFGFLFGLGGILLGLHVKGSWLALCAVGLVFGLYLVTTGLALTALCRTFMQANAVVNIGALLLAGFAGALVPYSLLPHWAQDISPVIPSYWAMQGYKHAIFGEGSTVGPILILFSFSVLSGLVALARFRFSDAKVGLA